MARMFPSCDPCLPHYRSLLVQGDYHPSAPIHLCLSVPTGSRVLLLSSSRKALIHSIGEHNSEWLHTNSGTGNTCRSSSKVDVFYPPTPHHLVLLLTTLRTHKASEPVPVDGRVILNSVPSLLVLHELSAYFLPMNNNKSYTIASYLLLVTHALGLATFLSEPQMQMRVALFDSQLDKLKLPILRAPTLSAFGMEESSNDTSGSESVAFPARKYFEWIATFNRYKDLPLEEDGIRRCTLTLHKQGSDILTDITWQWSEIPGQTHSIDDKPTTIFTWA